MQLKRNFFRQPASGFDENSLGRTNEQLAAFEAKVGFKLPVNYCQLMRQQNGGGINGQQVVSVEAANEPA